MGTWAVTSGIAHGLREHEAHPYVYGRYVNDGQYIVHEASPTSSGQPRVVYRPVGRSLV